MARKLIYQDYFDPIDRTSGTIETITLDKWWQDFALPQFEPNYPFELICSVDDLAVRINTGAAEVATRGYESHLPEGKVEWSRLWIEIPIDTQTIVPPGTIPYFSAEDALPFFETNVDATWLDGHWTLNIVVGPEVFLCPVSELPVFPSRPFDFIEIVTEIFVPPVIPSNAAQEYYGDFRLDVPNAFLKDYSWLDLPWAFSDFTIPPVPPPVGWQPDTPTIGGWTAEGSVSSSWTKESPLTNTWIPEDPHEP